MRHIYETEQQLLEIHRHDKIRFYGEEVAALLEEKERLLNESFQKKNSDQSH